MLISIFWASCFSIWRFGSQVFLLFFFYGDQSKWRREWLKNMCISPANTSQMVGTRNSWGYDGTTRPRLKKFEVLGAKGSLFFAEDGRLDAGPMELWSWNRDLPRNCRGDDEWSRYCDMLSYDMFVACMYTMYTYTTIHISKAIYLKYVRDLWIFDIPPASGPMA